MTTVGSHGDFLGSPGDFLCMLVGILVSLRPSVSPSFRLSVHPASRVRSVAPTVLIGSISYLCILSSNFRRCVTCKVSCKIKKILAIFFLICNFNFVLFWLGIWCQSTVWVIMGAVGGISECRHSSCDYFGNCISFTQVVTGCIHLTCQVWPSQIDYLFFSMWGVFCELIWFVSYICHCHIIYRDQSRYVLSQWETSLQCNYVSHWLSAYLDWSLHIWYLL